MNRIRIRSGALAALAISALFVTGGLVTSASAGASAATQSTDVDRWVVPETRQGGEYWTAERMRAATPGDVLVGDNVASAGRSDVEVGQEKKVAKQSRNPKVTPTATQQTPVDHIGKVFFTLGGSDYVCSGNAISAPNESTVATAGHCVNEGPGAFASRLVFVPAYENGAAPFGQWNATELYAPTQWTSGGDITYDTGFAIVSSPTGATLSDTVGASGVAFNEGRGLTYSAFGYPAAAPFTGNTLQSCSGVATDDPYAQSESQGIPCDMTGGSSGGPWFIGSGSAGYQNSVNSFGYNNVSNTMFGPYWGSVIESVYDAAAA
ncbi:MULTISPECIES: trypsin-like serine protease [Cryobacterium]|uniref:trypsin-like serine peptidase n=1 Tax=Cryobacterium TaxID=69578 RepID=UPI001F54627C|nr:MULTISPECIES: trypsin-like serine protease [Cryobacterium]